MSNAVLGYQSPIGLPLLRSDDCTPRAVWGSHGPTPTASRRQWSPTASHNLRETADLEAVDRTGDGEPWLEDATNKQVSNAYLSQIENSKIQKPSPNILHALAELYSISFQGLMDKAGYLTAPTPRGKTERHGRAATFAKHNLTAEEEAELMQYLAFMRNRRRPGDKT